MHKKLSTLALSALLISGCTNSKPSEFLNTEFFQGLFSNRPTTEEPFTAILKLQTESLLEYSTREEDGSIVINKDIIKQIDEEQSATIAELQALSPKIKILERYRLVLNGLAIWAPADAYEKIKALPNVVMTEKSGTFARPKALTQASQLAVLNDKTSVNYIGVEEAYKQNIRGEGMKVGIIDTGIDYTHKMFNGEGTSEAYESIDPSQPNAAFPNTKVVGGIDLAGTNYHSGSENLEHRIPVRDANPLDEGGHGTHVAGTVAGIGDGVNTYSGVAPEALLYAIKVFGAKGSTSDEVVIAGLEYAMDPNGDLQFDDKLDVVNLSLGSNYGSAHIMYNHAIRNLTKGGVIVVASGGNSGDLPYVVGAPGVSDEAISVASSVDNSDLNTTFAAAEFTFANDSLKTEFVEGAVTKPLADVAIAQGEIIFLGFADTDFEQEVKDQVKGKIAFIDRGKVAFTEKIKRAAEAGAIAVVVGNNAPGDAFVMGGEGKFEIPGVMITQEAAKKIKEHLQKGSVTANLKPAFKIEKPWLADTVSDFSSRGPRSEDGMIKPEIAAPGSNIISAAMGGGAKGEAMSGTSMAGPHMAGVMALLKQKFSALTPLELKSVAMGHTKLMVDEKKNQYSVSRQGAGRVQVGASLKAQVISLPASLSFGITDVEKKKSLKKDIILKNITAAEITVRPVWTGSASLNLLAPAVTLAAGESKTITVVAKISAAGIKNATDELDGYLVFENAQGEKALQVPALVVTRLISQVQAKEVVVQSTSANDAPGSMAEITIENKSANPGTAYLFNLLAQDGRKKDNRPDVVHNRHCDLQSAGYRIVERDGGKFIQFALKLFEGMTTWNNCEVNVQFDTNNDGIMDQELAGLTQGSLPGLSGEVFSSLLLDGTKARELRKKFETDSVTNPKTEENYTAAVIDLREMKVFDNSTLAIIEAELALVGVNDTGELSLKISTTHQVGYAVEYDDYLQTNDVQWTKISANPLGQAFDGIPEKIELKAQESITVPLQKGYAANNLILYAPKNKAVRDLVIEDTQSQIIPITYKAD
ncbi:S8 family serine peptidase [Bdellovibrio reynosensis]|uniref:S8 family serine peptidase n=1 Tax=Bdellovibrio reynosensis TaxID=2835041 RepID=A0ABY4CCM2_9BACT|nr:S8 family serine peptidase [Bdellovibrio reynosensis]UOF02469.1 S8 family serine peptidase [Bdellovibrio reynosensis]